MKSETTTRILTVSLCLYVFATLFSMAAMNIAEGIFLLSFFLSGAPIRDLRLTLKNPFVRLYLGVVAFFALTVLLSFLSVKISPVSYDPEIALPWGRAASKIWHFVFPVFLFAGFLKVKESDRWQIVRVWLITFILFSLVGLVQFFVGWPRPQPIPNHEPFFHVSGFIGFHLHYASVFIFPFFAALSLGLNRNAIQALRIPKWTILIGSFVGMIALILTFSRMLWIALPVGLLLWAVLVLPRRYAVGAVITVVLAAMASTQIPAIQQRISAKMGIGTRYSLWETNFEMFKENPVFGVGWLTGGDRLRAYYESQKRNEWFISHAHNNFLESLTGVGVVGTLAWIALILVIFLLQWRGFGAHAWGALAKGLFCAWFVFQLNGLTQVNFWTGKSLHQSALMMALTFVCLHVKRSGEKSA